MGLAAQRQMETKTLIRAVLVEWAQERKRGEGLDPTSTEQSLWEFATKRSREIGWELSGRVRSREGVLKIRYVIRVLCL